MSRFFILHSTIDIYATNIMIVFRCYKTEMAYCHRF